MRHQARPMQNQELSRIALSIGSESATVATMGTRMTSSEHCQELQAAVQQQVQLEAATQRVFFHEVKLMPRISSPVPEHPASPPNTAVVYQDDCFLIRAPRRKTVVHGNIGLPYRKALKERSEKASCFIYIDERDPIYVYRDWEGSFQI